MTTEPQAHITADLLVIGFGKGGKTLAAQFGRAGKNVVMIEQSNLMYGGTCINVGCVPTKALLHGAESYANHPAPQSVSAAGEYTNATTRVHALRDVMRSKNFAMLDTLDTVTVVTGHAAFIDPHTVRVTGGADELTISATTIVVNTGATPIVPALDGITSPNVATNVEMLDATALPHRLAIIGGGYLGLEFAGIYATFGTKVTVLDKNTEFMGRQDPDIAAAARTTLEQLDISLELGAEIQKITDAPDGTSTIHFTAHGTSRTVSADKILIASGRKPNLEGLNVAAAGLTVGPRGNLEVNEHLVTSQPHIYAVGDVNGGPQFTYISFDDARIVGDHLRGVATPRTLLNRGAVPTTVFLTPPLANVGVTETEALAQGLNIVVAKKYVADMMAMPRASILGQTQGLIKVIIDAETDLILGAALFSIDSTEVINLITLAMNHGITATALQQSIFTHPSASEGLNEVLGARSAPQ